MIGLRDCEMRRWCVYCTVQYSTVLYCTVLYSTALYHALSYIKADIDHDSLEAIVNYIHTYHTYMYMTIRVKQCLQMPNLWKLLIVYSPLRIPIASPRKSNALHRKVNAPLRKVNAPLRKVNAPRSIYNSYIVLVCIYNFYIVLGAFKIHISSLFSCQTLFNYDSHIQPILYRARCLTYEIQNSHCLALKGLNM